ncbi:hypothetical protein S7335_3615 [Synechococcus sp. PCC 7335]|uniref:hypothetical protein n=1 Tax=Synechococcus sp. (strain ATCC 29403 / PCC 7335) TaxID=91464 RepID=UPI00017EE479|nr:hypothetical protein [Synechococcus sp. PCC 7335]EDX85912.1 hypothetical protein S7335_3615 [Synechococcus sp. PCC 7335]
MNGLLIVMILALLIPIASACRDEGVWERMLAFASISTKTSLIVLIISVLRDDWMIGLAGVLILSMGNAAVMLLSQALRLVESD